ncbi:MAG: small, acid-soluble spore protein, alpha/beta type [bacterium]|nr:small, acid-soluble spore protein, alpha/beta type [bacterium]MDD3804761.1 small, acid-soluble spore protein, alpha/beta type [bacterium]MDD4152090.1 small, acid-soluble spore protein, alpha/beta type [bacterium]MDD4558027.1 small, acid-soluble spore protein, alpha/beta type [bacterium]
MAEGMSSKEATLRELEDEARKDLGITNIGPNMTTEEAGKLGGYMVKKLIERGERAMSEESHK